MEKDNSEHSHSDTEQSADPSVESLICPTCGKIFAGNNRNGGLRSNYNRHLLTHSDIRPYSCTQCDNTFTTSSNLKRHVQRRHPEAISEVLATLRSSSRAPTPARKSTTLLTPTAAKPVAISPNARAGDLMASIPTEALSRLDSSGDSDTNLLVKRESSPAASAITSSTAFTAPQPNVPVVYDFLTPSPLLTANRNPPALPPFLAFPPTAAQTATLIESPPTNTALHGCPHCEKQFVWRNSLTQHIHLHHRQVREQFVCDACQSVLSSMTKLRRHQREHCPFRDDTIGNRVVAVSFVKVDNTGAHNHAPTHRLRGKGKRRREIGGNEEDEETVSDEDGQENDADSRSLSDEDNAQDEYLYSSDEDLDEENKRYATASTISQSERNRRRHQKAKERKRRRREERKGAQTASQNKVSNSVPSSIASLLTCASLPISDDENSDDECDDNSTGNRSNHSSLSNSASAVRLSPVVASTVGKHLRSPASFTIRQFPNTQPVPSKKSPSINTGQTMTSEKGSSVAPSSHAAESKSLTGGDKEQDGKEVKSNGEDINQDASITSARGLVLSFSCPFTASGCKSKPFSKRRYLMNHLRRSHPEYTIQQNGDSDVSEAAQLSASSTSLMATLNSLTECHDSDDDDASHNITNDVYL